MSFVTSNAAYETWLRTACDVVEKDLDRKHERMSESEFMFLRATFFRWKHILDRCASHLLDAPTPLAIGDARLENFGTWRDAEGRWSGVSTISTMPR